MLKMGYARNASSPALPAKIKLPHALNVQMDTSSTILNVLATVEKDTINSMENARSVSLLSARCAMLMLAWSVRMIIIYS